MNRPSTMPRDADLQQRREAIRGGLARANRATFVVLLIVVGLAVAAIIAAIRAEQQARSAREMAEKLWQASTLHARASRFSGEIGWRQDALQAIATASRVRPSLALRNEAVAMLVSTDLQDGAPWRPTPPDSRDQTFDADLSRCAFVTSNRWVRVVRVEDQQELMTFDAPPSGNHVLQFSPDGRFLAARFEDGRLQVWDMTLRVLLRTERPKSNLTTRTSLDFSPDSRFVAVADADGFVRQFELSSGVEAAPVATGGRPHIIRYSPDGKTVAVSSMTQVQLWDLSTRKQNKEFSHPADVESLAWRADGSRLVAGCADRNIYVWSLREPRPQILAGHESLVNHVVFNQRGDLLASTSYDGTTRLWETASGRLLLSTQRGFARRFSRDDRHLAYSRSGLGFGIWTVVPAVGYRALGSSGGPDKRVWSLDISPDERLLAVMRADGLQISDLAANSTVEFVPMNGGRFVHFHPSGKSMIASTATELSIWPVESNPVVNVGETAPGLGNVRLGEPRRLALPKAVTVENGTLSYDGSTVVLKISSRDALLVELENPTRTVRFSNYPNLSAPAISPDKRWVATGTFHGRGTRIWDAHTGEPVKDLGGRHAGVTFSNDGLWLINSTPDAFEFFRCRDWRLVRRIARDSAGELPGLAVCPPAGKTLGISKSMRLLQLADADSGEELASLNAPDPKMINVFSMSGDHGILAAATADALIQVWDLQTIRRELARMGLDWGGENRAARSQSHIGFVSSPALLAFGRSNPLVLLAILGVIIAIVFAVLSLRRHRKLMDGYMQVDALVAERNHELSLAHTQMLHSQKMKALGTLAAGIAHDFNNLLSVIRMANQLTGEQTASNPDAQENFKLVEKAVAQGKNVVRSMLGYSREPGERGAYSVVELVEGTAALLSQQFLGGITLSLDLDRALPNITGVRNRLEQILLNLMVNASEAMKGKGDLRLIIRLASELGSDLILRPRPAVRYVEVIVADSGPGIAHENQRRVFEPFFTTKAVGTARGTGLGLSMVHSIAEEEGLGIRLESSPGRGTAFHIFIPLEMNAPE